MASRPLGVFNAADESLHDFNVLDSQFREDGQRFATECHDLQNGSQLTIAAVEQLGRTTRLSLRDFGRMVGPPLIRSTSWPSGSKNPLMARRAHLISPDAYLVREDTEAAWEERTTRRQP
jgi:hypothetical protein